MTHWKWTNEIPGNGVNVLMFVNNFVTSSLKKCFAKKEEKKKDLAYWGLEELKERAHSIGLSLVDYSKKLKHRLKFRGTLKINSHESELFISTCLPEL